MEPRTDEEQAEALKQWWKENGLSIVGGIALGAAVIGGWQGWNYYLDQRGAAASVVYSQLRDTVVAKGSLAEATPKAEQLTTEYASTRYAALGALETAAVAYRAGDLAATRRWLRWVLDNEEAMALKQIARLRLARLELADGKLEAAKALIDQASPDSLVAEFKLLAADLALAQGRKDDAVKGYQAALKLGVAEGEWVRMKLAELGQPVAG